MAATDLLENVVIVAQHPQPGPNPSGGRQQWSSALAVEVALVVGGVVLISLLFARSYQELPPPIAMTLDESTAGLQEHWTGIYVGEQKIGYSLSRSAKGSDGGALLQERTQLKLMLLGQPNDITLATDMNFDDDGRLSSLLAQVRTEVKGVPVSLRAEGKASAQGMSISLFQAGTPLTTLELDEMPSTSATLYRSVLSHDLEPGKRISIPYFNPLSLGHSEAVVTVKGREQATLPSGESISAWRFEVDHAGQKLDALIGVDGQRIRERETDGGLGMELRLEDRDTAIHLGWPGDVGDSIDLIALSSIPIDSPLPGGGRSLTELRLRVTGPDSLSKLLSAAHGERWVGEQNALTLVTIEPEVSSSYTLPSTVRAMRPWLRSTAFIAADNPVIRRTAGDIIGDGLDAITAARRLNSWVFQNLQKVPVAGFPESREILRSMRGDCNEHTTLYTALARSVGLPTRMAAGIVYSESIFSDGAFYYHAWPEVWLGKQWVAVDPTFGQFPADATHVKLVEGDLDQQMELMSAIGRLKVEVLTTGPQ